MSGTTLRPPSVNLLAHASAMVECHPRRLLGKRPHTLKGDCGGVLAFREIVIQL